MGAENDTPTRDFRVIGSEIIKLNIRGDDVSMQITKWGRGRADVVYISGFDNGQGFFTESPLMANVVDKTWGMTQAQKALFQSLPSEAQVRLEQNYYYLDQSGLFNYILVDGKMYQPYDFRYYFDQIRHESEYENESRST